jgi:hypothetical protein
MNTWITSHHTNFLKAGMIRLLHGNWRILDCPKLRYPLSCSVLCDISKSFPIHYPPNQRIIRHSQSVKMTAKKKGLEALTPVVMKSTIF